MINETILAILDSNFINDIKYAKGYISNIIKNYKKNPNYITDIKDIENEKNNFIFITDNVNILEKSSIQWTIIYIYDLTEEIINLLIKNEYKQSTNNDHVYEFTGWQSKYLNMINNILNTTQLTETRGYGFKSTIGNQLSCELIQYKPGDLIHNFPIITARKIPFSFIFEELMWILRGETDSKILESKGINIWKTHTCRKYLDSIGLNELPEGNIGKGYGYQMRKNKVDQLQYVFNLLEKDKYSRRIYINLWNPNDLAEMSLPPCHVSYHFICKYDPITQYDKLNLIVYQRSWDILVGWNMTTAALFLALVASKFKMIVGQVTLNIGDCHIYENNIQEATKFLEQTNKYYKLPSLQINNVDNFEERNFESIKLYNYEFNKNQFKFIIN